MNSRNLGFVFIAFILLCVGALAGLRIERHESRAREQEKMAARLEGGRPIRPVFLRKQSGCEPPSEAEIQLDEAVLNAAIAADAVAPEKENTVKDYAVTYFAWHWQLRRKERCQPSDHLIAQLAPILDRMGWPYANAELNDLRLIERLPPSDVRAKGLAEIAFLKWIPPSNLKGEDTRPYARQLLAEQGQFALPWSGAALNEIAGDTRLGTSAAYLAVATSPSDALPRVQQAISAKVASSRDRRVRAHLIKGDVPAIRLDDSNRLIELGYALARAGTQSEVHSLPIFEIMSEKFARSAPPFGVLAAEPTEFCGIAAHIGGNVAKFAESKAYCAEQFKPRDGEPRQFPR